MHAEQMNAPPTPGRLEIKAAGGRCEPDGRAEDSDDPTRTPIPLQLSPPGTFKKDNARPQDY